MFQSAQELAEAFALELVAGINVAVENISPFTIVLSGGSTPALLYSVLAEKYGRKTDWRTVHFFWGDERCVPPRHPESNYGLASRLLLDILDVPPRNIHRIRGEDIPEKEAVRYSDEILANTRNLNGIPVFDHVILGMGEDGHTVSIFPGNNELLTMDKICDVAVHPSSGQKRITITGKVINNSDNVSFLVTGHSKATAVEQILKKKIDFPAYAIIPVHGNLTWFLDKDAAEFIR
ncbi:MAG TPA: 6-phosphogluconolactonase [Bacteroidales bacterium]|nr:6-phosphogluconolactonase [Bacteroidales bacterium]